MRKPIISFLIAVTFLFLFGCSTTKPTQSDIAQEKISKLKDECRVVIKDSARAEKVIQQFTDLGRLFIEFKSEQTSHSAKIRELLHQYGTNEAALEKQMAEYNSGRSQRNEEALAIYESIRSSTTEEEWDELQKDIQRAIESVLQLAQLP